MDEVFHIADAGLYPQAAIPATFDKLIAGPRHRRPVSRRLLRGQRKVNLEAGRRAGHDHRAWSAPHAAASPISTATGDFVHHRTVTSSRRSSNAARVKETAA